MQIGSHVFKNDLILAPMSGVTIGLSVKYANTGEQE